MYTKLRSGYFKTRGILETCAWIFKVILNRTLEKFRVQNCGLLD